jgi:hypothetical protein
LLYISTDSLDIEGKNTMRNSQENEKPKRTTRKSGATVSSGAKKDLKPSTHRDEPTAFLQGSVLTQEEFTARVARKAFELYEKRMAMTALDDWLEAECLVKAHLLSEESGGKCV